MNYKCKWCGAERCGSSSRSRDRECYERVIKRLRERLKCIEEIATTRSDISVCARLVAINSVANRDDAAARVAERCAMLDRILESPFGEAEQ